VRIAIFGAGGVGGYFGGRLAAAGHDVAFIARGAHLAALRRDGLRVESPLGDFSVFPVEATDTPAEIGPVEAVLVAVKSGQVAAAGQAIPPLLDGSTFVVPLENGVEAPAELAQALGAERVLGGLCKIISLLAGPGHVHHVGAEPYVACGELWPAAGDRGAGEGRAERVVAALSAAGVRAQVPADIEAAMWEKFLFIAAVSGVGAVTRATLGELRTLPETRQLLEAAMREIAAVAAARGIVLKPDIVERTLRSIDALPAHGTASMQRDLMAGRPSELEYQSGAVVRLGKAAGVETPVHQLLYASLLPMERRAREKG
jgi:2-dehydropantoate 2-reductase